MIVRMLQMEPLYDDMRAAALEYAKAINVFAADLAAAVREHPGSLSCRVFQRCALWCSVLCVQLIRLLLAS